MFNIATDVLKALNAFRRQKNGKEFAFKGKEQNPVEMNEKNGR